MNLLEEAKQIEQETIDNRRKIHRFAELGFDLPKTVEFVTNALKSYGYRPSKLGKSGIVCTVGQGSPTILLRADMDALPMQEESGVSYAADNGNCHSCGHDCHTAILLSAAKLLKRHENALRGTVKFMFQPAEEILAGAQDMINAGVLSNPDVDAAMAMHVVVGQPYAKPGTICYISGCVANSGDAIRIVVHGVDGHGSRPELAVDAIHIAAHIVLALDELVSREIPTDEDTVVLVGRIEGGTTCNSVGGTATLEISVRTTGHQERSYLLRRIREIAEGIAATFRATAEFTHLYGTSPLINDNDTLKAMTGYLKEILPDDSVFPIAKNGGSEDFTMIAERVPSVFLHLSAGRPEDGYTQFVHHPSMQVDESALAYGVAAFTHCAIRWLESHKIES